MSGTLPDGFVLDSAPQSAALPDGFVVDPGHPVVGPTNPQSSLPSLTDIGRNIYSGVTNAVAGLSQWGDQFRHDIGIPSKMPSIDPKTGNVVPAVNEPPQTLDAVKDKFYNALGMPEYVPQTELGRMGQGAAGAAALSVTNPAAIPAALGGGATSRLAQDMFPNHPELAGLLGFIPGATLAKGVANLPLPPGGGSLDPQTAALARTATDSGIPLSLAQVSNNPFVRYAYAAGNKLPFSGEGGFREAQQAGFNRAVSNAFGEDATKITPEVLAGARARIGGVMNDVAGRTTINADPQFVNDLANVESNAQGELTADQWSPISKQLDNVLGKVGPNDTITGEQYQALTKYDTPLGRAMRASDVGVRAYANQIRDALDSALERSASPDDLQALQQARAQWKALRTVEPLTLRADTVGGATPSTGDISPAALRGAVNQSYQNAALAPTGKIPLNDLARVGQRFLKEPPDSGTANREMVQNMATHGAEAFGALAGGVGLHEAGLPAVAAFGAPIAAGLGARAINSVLRAQPLVNRAISAGINPNGFQFTGSPLAPVMPAVGVAAPFGWGVPAIPPNTPTP